MMSGGRTSAVLRLADFVIRRRWYVIGGVILITLVMGWQAMNVGLNADFSTYLRQDDPLVQEYNRVGDLFGGSSVGIVLVSGKNVFTKDNLELVKKLTAAYQDVKGIAYVTSLVNVTDFRKTDFGFEVGKLLDRGRIPRTPEEMQAFRAYVMQKDRYEGNLVSDDGATTAIVLRFAGGGKDAISRFVISLRIKAVTDEVAPPDALPADTRIYYGGMPFLIFNMTLLITNNLYVLVPLMVFVLILILYIGFRHWAGVVFPMLVVLISDIWLVGLMGVFGYNFDLLTGIIPVLLLALGSADGIHLLKRYFERRRNGENAGDASRLIFLDMGKPIVLTTITTMVGFASLVVSDFSVIKQFGLLAALGVLLALVITLTLLPALLSFGVTMKAGRVRAAKSSRFLHDFSTFVYRRKSFILVGAAVAVVVFVFAIPRIQKDVDWSLCLQKDSAPYHAEMLLRKKFGGSLPLQILVSGDMKDPATLKLMHVIERRLNTVPLVSGSQSIAGIIAEMNDVMNDRYIVPEHRRGVANLWFLIEDEDMMEQMVENGDREGLLQAKLSTWHTGSLVNVVDTINAFLATLPAKIAVVDLDSMSPANRKDFLSIKKRQMLRNLRWDLQGYGASLEENDLLAVVNRALVVAIDSGSRRKVRDAVIGYLRSPEAEVELSGVTADRIGIAVSRGLDANQPIDTETFASIIDQNAQGIEPDDAR
ncbi:MAG: MMPL family transporter, partial [Chlorobi bacterium]|nr:MMPL family transporter [Chlorobiota bacterium]